jgi:hypothetical protein
MIKKGGELLIMLLLRKIFDIEDRNKIDYDYKNNGIDRIILGEENIKFS